MKDTSIQANIAAEAFKGKHKKRIINCMEGKMTGKDIAEKSGIDYNGVMRRMLELENANKVVTRGKKGRYTLYELIY
jgi:predicted ArsR family transcriptional regulator